MPKIKLNFIDTCPCLFAGQPSRGAIGIPTLISKRAGFPGSNPELIVYKIPGGCSKKQQN
jgi:hypothetical protein